jgi:muramoyltetrapeptide carboxypeptidase
MLIGFSDISCLISAFWTRLGWPGIHGPMPGSSLWGQNSTEDIAQLLALLKDGQAKQGMLRLSPIDAEGHTAAREQTGWLFGGCFSVLTNLIGTPYLPRSLAGALLLFEDTGENYGRLLRYWNQWLQSGILDGVRGIVLGRFSDLEAGSFEAELKAEFARRCGLPCWSSEDFGHVSPNFPFVIGAQGSIAADGTVLRWQLYPL